MPPDAPAAETSGGRLDSAIAAEPDAGAGGAAAKPTRATEEHGPARTAALIAKHVAIANEAKGGANAPEADDPKPGDEATGKAERGPDGKFLKPAMAAAKPADAKPKEPAGEVPSSIARARRLVQDGKVEEVLELVGLDPEKLQSSQWQAWRKNNEKAKAEVAQERQQVLRDRAEVQHYAQQLAPLLGAQQAYRAGDFDSALKLAFGDDVSSFNRKAIQKLHGTAAPDPETQRRIAVAEQRAAAAEQAARQLAESVTQGQRAKVNEAAVAEYKATELREELEALGEYDASDDALIDAIFAELQKNWNGTSTLSVEDAAVIASKRLQRQRAASAASAPGAQSGSQRDRGAKTTRQPAGAVTPARRAGRPATNLNSQEAAEAAPAPKLKGKDLRDYWVRQAEAAALRGEATG